MGGQISTLLLAVTAGVGFTRYAISYLAAAALCVSGAATVVLVGRRSPAEAAV